MFEELSVLYRGLILGLIIAAPVGPVGLLCIRRTVQKGMVIGLCTGLGAACADAIFATIAVLGVSAVLDFIHHYEAAIRLIGGGIVLYSAFHTWRDHPRPPKPRELVAKVLNLAQETTLMGTVRATFSGLIITLTNPLTLFGTLAVIATFGGLAEGLEPNLLVAGIFIGSALWWGMLSGGVSLLSQHFTEKRIITINRCTSIGLAVLGGWALFSGMRSYLG